MIRCHPKLDDSSFRFNIEDAIKAAELTGFVSYSTLKQLYNLFSWVYLGKGDPLDSVENIEVKKFLSVYDLYRFKGASICYSAVLFYQKLSFVIDLRKFDLEEIVGVVEGGNKLISSSSFSFPSMYKLYAESKGDLGTEFLLFNSIFTQDSNRTTKILDSYTDITNLKDLTAPLRPDFEYNLAVKNLLVKKNELDETETKRTLYIIQDSTYSMQEYESQIKMLMGFILNEALSHDYVVEWLFVSKIEHHRIQFTRQNINAEEHNLLFGGVTFDTSIVLTSDEFIGKQVVIITDGTDMFEFPFVTKTKSLNVISFLDNINIKNKIATHGRFFRAFA